MKELRQELIGKPIVVEGTKISGTIINETKNTITIETTQGQKRVNKNNHEFIITTAQGKMRVAGQIIMVRPEDRIKHNW